MVRYCVVSGCESTSKKNPLRRFFMFPKDAERLAAWIRILGPVMNMDPNCIRDSYTVCDLHFPKSDQYGFQLTKTSIPTCNLPQQQSTSVSHDNNEAQAGLKTGSETSDQYSVNNSKFNGFTYVPYDNEDPDEDPSVINEKLESDEYLSEINVKIDSDEEPTEINVKMEYDDEDVPKELYDNSSTTELSPSCSQPKKRRLEDLIAETLQEEAEKFAVNGGVPVPFLDENIKTEINVPLQRLACVITEPNNTSSVITDFVASDPLNIPAPVNGGFAVPFLDENIKTEENMPLQRLAYVITEPNSASSVVTDVVGSDPLNIPAPVMNVKTEPFDVDSDSEDAETGGKMSLETFAPFSRLTKPYFFTKRFSSEYRVLALNLYLSSPSAYKSLFPKIYLPGGKAMYRFFTTLHVTENLHDEVIKSLKRRINMFDEDQKYCIMLIEEPLLKYMPNKDKDPVFVVMIRGISSNWSHILGIKKMQVIKSPTELKTWFVKIVTILFDIGFVVKGLTVIPNPQWMSVAEAWNVNAKQPFIYINARKIHYMYDVPSLMSDLCETFKKTRFSTYDSSSDPIECSWFYVNKLYTHDLTKKYRLAPKLTAANIHHVAPKGSLGEVKSFAQIFSMTNATALHTYIDMKVMPEEVTGTATFLEAMNDLFDVLHSAPRIDKSNDLKNSFRNSPKQNNAMTRAYTLLSNIIPEGKLITDIKCIDGLQLTIKATLSLVADLRNYGINQLYTRRLNMDPVRNFYRMCIKNKPKEKRNDILDERDDFTHIEGDILDDFFTLLTCFKNTPLQN